MRYSIEPIGYAFLSFAKNIKQQIWSKTSG